VNAAAQFRPLTRLLQALVWAYRLTLSPLIGPVCRYQPSCSAYALEAIEAHGPIAGLWLAARRILRCHPWGGSGLDPVPPAACRHHTAAEHGIECHAYSVDNRTRT
jgi:uncharacterized protein